MKIGEARVAYNAPLKAYHSKQVELAQKKSELEEKIKKTENGAVVYQNEAAILELQYNAVAAKKDEYQDYMTNLMEQWAGEVNKEVSKQQSEAMAEYGKDMAKIMLVARRIMKGDKVPASDEEKLAKYDYKLYAMAKNAGAIAEVQKRKEHKSLWADEEPKEYDDAMEVADGQEAFSDGPEIVDVDETIEAATADMDISIE